MPEREETMPERETDPSNDELLTFRAVRLTGPVGDEVAKDAIARLLFLQYEDRAAPVYLLVDSPGGSVAAGMAILDTMKYLAAPVYTHCTGYAAGMALWVVAHGARGHRTASAGARFMFVPLWSPGGSDASEDDLERARRELAEVLARDTGRSEAEVRAVLKNGQSLSAAEALAWGIVDGVGGQPHMGPSVRPMVSS